MLIIAVKRNLATARFVYECGGSGMGYFDRWICTDCGVELEGQEYMIWDELWLSVMPGDTGHLCLLCLEERLGRPLDPDRDFTWAPLNAHIAQRLVWVRQIGREQLLEWSRQRLERLDRRNAQAKARRERARAARR